MVLNPKYRGPKWDWEWFVPHAVKWAETSVNRSFTYDPVRDKAKGK